MKHLKYSLHYNNFHRVIYKNKKTKKSTLKLQYILKKASGYLLFKQCPVSSLFQILENSSHVLLVLFLLFCPRSPIYSVVFGWTFLVIFAAPNYHVFFFFSLVGKRLCAETLSVKSTCQNTIAHFLKCSPHGTIQTTRQTTPPCFTILMVNKSALT